MLELFGTSDQAILFGALSALSVLGWAFGAAIPVRDLTSRLLQTGAEQEQARIRNLFATRAPHVFEFISDVTYDDWDAPYDQFLRSCSYVVWVLISGVSAVLFGAGVGLVLVVSSTVAPWLRIAIAVLSFALCLAVTIGLLNRVLRMKARAYAPRFPRART